MFAEYFGLFAIFVIIGLTIWYFETEAEEDRKRKYGKRQIQEDEFDVFWTPPPDDDYHDDKY